MIVQHKATFAVFRYTYHDFNYLTFRIQIYTVHMPVFKHKSTICLIL